ncbi:MAG: hypothetical protein MUF51_00625, partial [Vicinamibacteria bacterium]|nr:hypothetical protein [Vicinamibacteria bacterium]
MTENPGIPSPVPLDIRYLEPLLKAWHRMRRILFAPFAIGQYLLLGFTAWLAGLLDGQGGGGGRRFEFKNEGPIEIVDKINEFLQQIGVAWARFTARPFWAALAIFIVLLAITVILVLLWLTSRAKFIYLDNVVRGRARFFEPWHAYAAQGNSLFLFRIGFGLIVFLVIVGLIMLGLGSGIFCLTMRSAVSILSLIMIVIFMLAFIACMAYVQLFTESFVMPIMYKYR